MPLTPSFVSKRDFSSKQRKEFAKEHKALPNGSYPIENAEDLKNAIALAHMGSTPFDEVKAHIMRRAAALGLEDRIPASWKAQKRDITSLRL